MKRLAIALGLILGAAALVCAFVPWTISTAANGETFLRRIGSAAGLDSAPPSRITFVLLPRPQVDLENVSIRDPAGVLSMSASEAEAAVRLLPLLSGRLAFSSVTLVHPIVDVDLDRTAAVTSSGTSASDPPEQAPRLASSAFDPGFVRIVDGVVNLHSSVRRIDNSVRSIEGRLDWQSPDSPGALTLSGKWRGKDAALTAWLSDPALLMRGGSAPAKMEFDAELLSAKFDGLLWGGKSWRFEGNAQASTPSAPSFERWIGATYRLPHAFGAASANGRLAVDRLGATFSSLSLSIAGSDFEGEAAWGLTPGKPILTATLASDYLNLTPFIAETPRLSERGGWSQRQLSSITGTMMNLDFRISANRARLGKIQLAEVGLSVLLEDGRLDLILPEAKAYGGRLSGRLTALMNKTDTSISASGSMEKVDIGDLLWAAADFDSLSGSASGRFSFDGRGASIADIVGNLSGAADFSVSDGEILGVDFEQALRRVDKRPLSVGSEIHGGSTPFSAFTGHWDIGGGEARLLDGAIAGPGARIELSGSTELKDRSLSLRAAAQQAGADGAISPSGSRLTLAVAGFWDDPRLLLDAEGLVRRSEAAAPLFDAGSSTQ